jgi:hypothetical protein
LGNIANRVSGWPLYALYGMFPEEEVLRSQRAAGVCHQQSELIEIGRTTAAVR